MIINSSTLSQIFTGFDTRFQAAYQATQPFWPAVATEVPSGGAELRHAWLAKIPRMREWIGDRVVQNLAAHGFTIVNKDYELTLAVGRNNIADDQIGVYNGHVDMMGIQAARYPDDLVVGLLQNGATSLCYDGQYFFDSDHPVNVFDPTLTGSQVNYATSTPLTWDNYVAKRALMAGYLGEDNKPMGIVPNLLVVPPQLEGVARLIVEASYIVNTVGAMLAVGVVTTENVMKGTAKVLVVPELSADVATWYLLDTSKPIKPFVFQNREAVHTEYMNQLTDENVFWRKEFVYGAAARGNAGYGLWFLASKWVG